MAAAHTALADPDTTVDLRTWRNRLTADAEDAQIRLGPDSRWHPYRREGHGVPATSDATATFLAARTAGVAGSGEAYGAAGSYA